MTTKVASLEIVEKQAGYTLYRTPNQSLCRRNIILKVYSDTVLRLLTSYTTKGLIGSIVGTNIEYDNQRVALALSEIPQTDWPKFFGRVLLVRRVEIIPFDFIFKSRAAGVIFAKDGKIISYDEAVSLIPGLNGNSSDFLDNRICPVMHSIFSRAANHLKERGLSIGRLKINFAIESCGDELFPIWVGEGINPNNAIISHGNERITDYTELARIIIPLDT